MDACVSESARLSAAVVADFMWAARVEIDRQFGEGFAQANPALLGSFIHAMAVEREVGQLRDAVQSLKS